MSKETGCCCQSELQEPVSMCCEGPREGQEEDLRKKKRTDPERQKLLRRLAIIEGQVRGIRGMLEKDAYCIDILTQVAAANCALNSFSKELLSEHIRTCVATDIRSGNEQKLDELIGVLPKLMK